MKIFTNKNIIQKLAIVALIVLIFSFVMSGHVEAFDGGKLFNPIIDLFVALGDGVNGIIHKIIQHHDEISLTIDFTTSIWETISTVLIGVLVAAAVVGLVAVTAGGAAVVFSTTVSVSLLSAGAVLIASGTAGVVAANVYNAYAFPDDELIIPMYTISSEEIFKGDIALFDVDFFNPMADKEKNVSHVTYTTVESMSISYDKRHRI